MKSWLRSQPRQTSVPARRLFNAYQRRLRGGDLYKKDLKAMEMAAQLHEHSFRMGQEGIMFTTLLDKDQSIVEKYEGGTRFLRSAATLYLLAKHKHDCTPVGGRLYSRTQLPMTANLTWSAVWPDFLLDFYFEIDGLVNRKLPGASDELYPPFYDPFYRMLREFRKAWNNLCAGSDKRFIFIFLSLMTGSGKNDMGHANVLIYDRERNELEHFEPHGGRNVQDWCDVANKEVDNQDFDQLKKVENDPCDDTSLDRAIVKHLQPIIGFETYIPATSYCPYIGFQGRQALKKVGVDPAGFCQYWSIYYIDLRLSNPDTPREELVQNAMEKIDAMTTDFGKFIRSYATFMAILVRMIRSNRDRSKHALQRIMSDMIEEFTDDVNYKQSAEKKPEPKKKCCCVTMKGARCKKNAVEGKTLCTLHEKKSIANDGACSKKGARPVC